MENFIDKLFYLLHRTDKNWPPHHCRVSDRERVGLRHLLGLVDVVVRVLGHVDADVVELQL